MKKNKARRTEVTEYEKHPRALTHLGDDFALLILCLVNPVLEFVL